MTKVRWVSGFDLERVMIAIDLYDELFRNAGEIREVRTDGMLPTEFHTLHTMRAQEFPHDLLGPSCGASKVSRSFRSVLWQAPTSPSPCYRTGPLPLPRFAGGEGA
jgi:hypothetical protein